MEDAYLKLESLPIGSLSEPEPINPKIILKMRLIEGSSLDSSI